MGDRPVLQVGEKIFFLLFAQRWRVRLVQTSRHYFLIRWRIEGSRNVEEMGECGWGRSRSFEDVMVELRALNLFSEAEAPRYETLFRLRTSRVTR